MRLLDHGHHRIESSAGPHPIEMVLGVDVAGKDIVVLIHVEGIVDGAGVILRVIVVRLVTIQHLVTFSLIVIPLQVDLVITPCFIILCQVGIGLVGGWAFVPSGWSSVHLAVLANDEVHRLDGLVQGEIRVT